MVLGLQPVTRSGRAGHRSQSVQLQRMQRKLPQSKQVGKGSPVADAVSGGFLANRFDDFQCGGQRLCKKWEMAPGCRSFGSSNLLWSAARQNLFGYCLGGCRVDPCGVCLPAHVAAADITRCDKWQHCHFFM
eukprot:s1603_g2.t1